MGARLKWGLLATAGIVMVALGFGLGFGAFPSIIDGQIKKNLDIWDPESEGRENFDTPPVDVYMKFFIYHVTNPEEVVAGTEKPHVEERGPYAYREKRQKIYATNNTDGGDFIVYGQEKAYFFDESQSCEGCTKDDVLTVVNAPLIGFSYLMRNYGLGGIARSINKAITEGEYSYYDPVQHQTIHDEDEAWLDTLFMNSTVDDLIFSGTIPGALKFVFKHKLVAFEPLFPPQIQVENGFAALNTKNASTFNEWYEVWTGANDHMDKYLEINRWGQDNVTLWPDLTKAYWWKEDGGFNGSNACNLLKGSDGQQFPPDVKEDEKFYVFATDICRSIFITYQNEQDIDGIKALRFAPPPTAFQVNTTENVGFCMEVQPDVDWDNCIMTTDDPEILNLTKCFEDPNYNGHCFDGTLDITRCMQKAPLIMSNPHFYQSPEELRLAIDGLTPADPEIHETRLDIEPYLGMAIRLHKRVQFNMPMYQYDKFDCMKNINDTLMPFLWVDEGADIDEENIKKLKKMLFTPLKILEAAKWAMIVLGAIVALLGGFMFAKA